MITIAIIEDEEDLLELLEFNLSKEGFDVVGFLDTKNVKNFIIEENPSLLIVDRNLPGKEGSLFVKELREEGFNLPVIFLSAKASDDEILEGFERGGDDYLKKPFNMKELIARVKAILKRNNITQKILAYKNLKLDLENHTLIENDKKIALTKKEFLLLEMFFKNQNKIFSKEEISSILGVNNEKSAIVAINRLNNKIHLIENIRGMGYKLK